MSISIWFWIVIGALIAVYLVIVLASYLSLRKRLRTADQMAAAVRNETVIRRRTVSDMDY
jgi:purine-cytosine permease-like protein